ncbi:MAG TPA: hypothetical protein PLF90_06445 [bacterium]|nr:hypothetical protein [bacterium]
MKKKYTLHLFESANFSASLILSIILFNSSSATSGRKDLTEGKIREKKTKLSTEPLSFQKM